MKICMIAEGCYPYVVGGVSGWIQMMLKGLDSYTFDIFTIAVDESQRGVFKYELPPNVDKVWENFLLDSGGGAARRRKRRLPAQQAQSLKSLVLLESEIPWRQVYETVHDPAFSIDGYLGSYDFFDAAKERYVRDEVNVPFSDYLWTLRSMFLPLFTILAKDIPEADVYHSVSAGYAGVVGALGSLLYNKPFILSEHGIYTREREEELIRSQWTKGYFKEMWISQFYALSRFAYDRADAVVSLFAKNATIQEELGCPREKIHIIPNGVSAEDYADVAWQRQPDGYINIGAVIRVTPIKDIKTMIMAFNVVKRSVPQARFFILGPYDEDPDYHQECVDLIAQLGLQDVEMPGRVNVRDYLPKMDIMVLTSISEGQPLAILEGMLFHKPWVATNVGSCQDLLYGMGDGDVGEAGIVAPVMDVQHIAEAIMRLAGDERLRLDMGETGYQRVTARYRLSDMFDSYRRLYDTLEDK